MEGFLLVDECDECVGDHPGYVCVVIRTLGGTRGLGDQETRGLVSGARGQSSNTDIFDLLAWAGSREKVV